MTAKGGRPNRVPSSFSIDHGQKLEVPRSFLWIPQVQLAKGKQLVVHEMAQKAPPPVPKTPPKPAPKPTRGEG